jgi:hypothetical protein
LILTLSDVVPQGAIAVQHDAKLGTMNFRMLNLQAGYHGTTTLKFIRVPRPCPPSGQLPHSWPVKRWVVAACRVFTDIEIAMNS